MNKRRRLSDASSSPSIGRVHPAGDQERASKRRFFGKSHLLCLPQELILRILRLLPVKALLIVSRTSHKLQVLASDPQIWKSRFWTKFVHPRLRRRALLGLPAIFGYHGIPDSLSAKDWEVWLDDCVLVQEERALAARPFITSIDGTVGPQRLPTATATLKSVRLDWRGKFRLRSNWEHGSACTDQLGLLTLAPKPENAQPREAKRCWRGVLIGCFYQGYFFSVDCRHGIRVFSCGNSTCSSRIEIAQKPVSLGNPVCIKVDEALLNDTSSRWHENRGIDFVIGYHNNGFAIYHFDPRSRQLSEKYLKRGFDESERIELVAFCFPYLITITNLNRCSVFGFHSSMIERGGDSCTILECPPVDQPLLPPKLVASLAVDETWLPSCLSFRTGMGTCDIVGSVVFSVRSVIVGSSIIVQEFHLSWNSPELKKTQVASPPLHEALDQVFFGRTAHMAFTTPTCVSYRYPFIITSHADNTLMLYSLHAVEDGTLTIEPGYQLWGHNTSVTAVEVGLKKAVSVDRRGEVRVWDLQGRCEKRPNMDRSTRVGGSGDPLSLNLDRKQGVQIERCLVGFGDEDIVVMERVKDLELLATNFQLVLYNFT